MPAPISSSTSPRKRCAPGYIDASLTGNAAADPETLAAARADADATLFRRNNAGTEPQQYLRGTIATGDRFVSGCEAKAAAIAATQGDCVEMEGAAIAHIAAKNGIDCLVLRAISDNCDESYDALSSREFDLEEYAASASSLVLSIVRRLAVKLGVEPRD